MNPVARRRNAKKVIVLLLLGFCSPSPDNILDKKFIYTSGCGGCVGAGFPPKPLDTSAANGFESNGDANELATDGAAGAGVDALATDGGSGGGV